MSDAASRAGAAHGGGSSPLRWLVLALAAITVSSSYYESDVIGSVADLLERQRGFSQSQIGMLNGIINVPNVALALINGILIDRFGPARMALWSAAIGVVGAALTAIGEPYALMVGGPLHFRHQRGGDLHRAARRPCAVVPAHRDRARHVPVPEPRPGRVLRREHLDGVGACAV